MSQVRLRAWSESWPIAGSFTISRGSKREAAVVVVEATEEVVEAGSGSAAEGRESGGGVGRGECVPYARYGQTVSTTLAEITALGPVINADRDALARRMAPSAARNAIDCALWDLEAKRSGRRVHVLAGLPALLPQLTCYTLSLDEPAAMADRAAAVAELPLLKLKLGEAGAPERDAARMRLVRRARPDARLVADANEGWRAEDVGYLLGVAAECGLETVEQPLPSDDDASLAHWPHAVPVCADESAHASVGLASLLGRYDAVNIKLDKTGGLTEALAMAREAQRLGLRIMVGCMVATSLAMAPALLVAQQADWVDLDGPLLLERDRSPGLVITGGVIAPPSPLLWG